MVLQMPEQLELWDKRGLERKCGEKIDKFTYNSIHCRLDQDGKRIWITNGWKNEISNYMFDDGDLVPGILYFEIAHFRNPRSILPTGPWSIYIANTKEKIIYQWEDKTKSTV